MTMTLEDSLKDFDVRFGYIRDEYPRIWGDMKGRLKATYHTAYIAGLDAAKGAVPEEVTTDMEVEEMHGFNSCRQQTFDAIEREALRWSVNSFV